MSGDSWKLIAFADRETIRGALVAQEEAAEWDPEVVLTGFELTDSGSSPGQAGPHEWRLDAYFPRRPSRADRAMVAALFGGTRTRLTAEKLPKTDWVAMSQQGFEPIRAGRFHVRTPDQPASGERGVVEFAIPASQAFGTGQHATTSGCLTMLDAMKRRGVVVRNCADIGTGTGLLAFAALALWPRAMATASDIDPVCLGVVEENSRANGVVTGTGPGRLTVIEAAGVDHPLIESRWPYDLLIANILARPLVELAGDFSRVIRPRGSVLLAGLLETQEAAVRSAYRPAGFRLAARLVNGDWSILWLRKRF